MIYHAGLERGNSESSGTPELFRYHLHGVHDNHLEYFCRWDKLIDLESKATAANYHRIWTLSSQVRQVTRAKCIGGLRLSTETNLESETEKVTLIFRQEYNGQVENRNVVSMTFSVGDRVVVSVEKRSETLSSVDIEDLNRPPAIGDIEPNLCSGRIVSITTDEVHVDVKSLSKRLRRYVQLMFPMDTLTIMTTGPYFVVRMESICDWIRRK